MQNEEYASETQPFKTLEELYDGLKELKPWPPIVELRESTEYVFRGDDSAKVGFQMQKLQRDEQPRTLVCHDMKGGYADDRFVSGSSSHDGYVFYHWSVVDTFVYFSHHFITIPPYGWVCAAHKHGVKVLGTVITERTGILEPILESEDSVKKFIEALVFLAKTYRFEGWLLNVENTIRPEDMPRLLDFVSMLSKRMHEEVEASEVIWYDSVTKEGHLKWQNELNELNEDFFLNCDGIFLNYNWTEAKLLNSFQLSQRKGRDPRDVYVGLDVWGRGCPGGGGFNSKYALQKIRDQGLSVAIFAPGWTHEHFGPKTFPELEKLFWARLFPLLFVHLPIYDGERFKTSFCRGTGTCYYRYGEPQLEVAADHGNLRLRETPFFNLALQQMQPSVAVLQWTLTSKQHEVLLNSASGNKDEKAQNTIENNTVESKETENTEAEKPESNCFEFCDSFSYEGGGCLKIVTTEPEQYHRLFLVHIEFPHEMQGSVVFEAPESGNATFNEPILVLGNDTGSKSIQCFKSERLNSRWRKCLYVTNMRTVYEIGVAFSKEGVCFLGEICLEQRRHQFENFG